jgi:hypothetical protein
MYTTCGNTNKRGGLAFDIRRSTQLQPWDGGTCSLASVNQDDMVSRSDCGQHPNVCSCMQRHLRLMCTTTTTTVAPTATTTTSTATSAATPTHQELNCPCHAHSPASNCRNIFCRRRAKERRPPFLPTSNECRQRTQLFVRLHTQMSAVFTVACACDGRQVCL